MRRKGIICITILAMLISLFSANVSANTGNFSDTNTDFHKANSELVVYSKNIETDAVTRHEYSFSTEETNFDAATLSSEGYVGTLPSQIQTPLPNNMNSPRQVIEDDTRYPIETTNIFPYRAICRTTSYWDKNGDKLIEKILIVTQAEKEQNIELVTSCKENNITLIMGEELKEILAQIGLKRIARNFPYSEQ